MQHTSQKPRITWKDRLTAYLVLMVIVCFIGIGAFALYLTGIFDPVEVTGEALADTTPLALATIPPPEVDDPAQDEGEANDAAGPDAAAESAAAPRQSSALRAKLLDFLVPRAAAEEADAAEMADAAPRSEDELGALLAEIEAQETGEEEITEDQRVAVDKNDLAKNPNLPEDIYSVLLLATDSRDVNSVGGRSDVLIIASLDRTLGEIKLASVSRDLWVPISGTSNNKINAAYAFGGPYLALKTINEQFELNLEDYVVVNFATMASIIDSLGGVDITLTGMEYAYINYLVAVGEDYEGFAKSSARRALTEADAEETMHLDGLQAVSYARIRKLDSDIQRGSRQRILLQAMMDRAMSNLSLSTFYSLAMNMLNTTSTNIKLTTVMDVGNWLLSLDAYPAMREMAIPVAGSYRGSREKEMDVLVFNRGQNVEALHTFLFGAYMPAVSPAEAP